MEKEKAIEIINEFYDKKLDFCTCGTPENIHRVIKETLKYLKEKHDSNGRVEWDKSINGFKTQLTITTISENMFCGITDFILNVLDNVGIVEHGSSICNGWLTDEGRELLEAYEVLDDNDINSLAYHIN